MPFLAFLAALPGMRTSQRLQRPAGVFGNGVCEIGEVELGCPDCPQMMACPRSTHVEVGQAGIPCSGQGFCAGATGRCLCDRGYSGVSCEVCAAGYRAARGSCRPEESATEERGPGVPPGGFTGATGAAQGGWQGGERSQGGDQAPEERNLNVLAIAVLGGAVGVLVGAVSAAIACRCWVLHHGQRPANIELGYDGLENRPRCGPASKAAELTGGWGALRTERPGAHHGMETSVVSSHISHPKQGAASASPHPGRIQEARLAGQLYVRHGRGRGVFARPSQAPSAAHSRSRFDHLWGRAQAIETPLAAENSSNQSPATASSLRRPAACHKAEDWRSPARQVGGGTPSASLDSLDHECSRETSPGCPARVHSCSVGPELERLWSTPQVGQPRDFKDTQAQTMPSRIQSDVSTMTDTDHVRGAGVVVTNRQVEKHEGCGQRVDHGLGQPAANIRIGQTWRDGDLVIETATPGGHQQLLSISVSLHHHTHLAGWQDDAEAGVGRHPGVIQQGAGGVAEEDGAVAARTGRRQQPRNTRGTNGR